MARIAGEIVIDRTVDDVFDFVADERNEPRLNPRMVRADQISTGPIGLDTRWHAEMTTRGRPVPMIIEITGYERPRRLASSTHLPNMEINGALTFDPVPEDTRMRWEWEVRPRGALKLMNPMIAPMGGRQERAIWGNLKRYLEAQAAWPTDVSSSLVRNRRSTCPPGTLGPR